MISNKQDVIAQIISLAAENGISVNEIETAMLGSKPAKISKESGGGIAIKIFSILGGIFICAGIFRPKRYGRTMPLPIYA